MNVQPLSNSTSPTGSPADATPRLAAAPQRTATEAPASTAADRKADVQDIAPLAVEEAVKRIEEFVKLSGSEINFSIDTESGMRIVKVTDKATEEVIRQIPSEEVVAIARALDKLQGLFLRDKV